MQTFIVSEDSVQIHIQILFPREDLVFKVLYGLLSRDYLGYGSRASRGCRASRACPPGHMT